MSEGVAAGGGVRVGTSDQRHLSVAGLRVGDSLVAVTASSNAALTAHALDLAAAKPMFRTVAELRHHVKPVLCVATVTVPPDADAGGAPSHLLFSGGTDGSLAAWDLGPAVANAKGAASNAAVDLAPLHAWDDAHQSGVNCVAAANVPGPPGRVLVVTGGDDQAVRVAVCHASASHSPLKLQVLQVFSRPLAHASAVRGAWTDGAVAITTGLDQRVNVWGADLAAGALGPLASCVTEVVDSEALDVLEVARGETRELDVAVVGRGLQLVHCTLPAGFGALCC